MTYQEAISGAKISRSCWTGMYVDTVKNKLCWLHDDSPKVHSIPFKPTNAELNATDWNIVSGKESKKK